MTAPASASASSTVFIWWQRQILTLLPGLARFRPAVQDAVIIDIQSFTQDPDLPFAAAGQILVRRSGREVFSASLDFQRPSRIERDLSDTVILRLPPEMILRREVTVPAAAERDLPALIHFQMPRLTPFEADDVYWGISEPVRDAARLKLTLHLAQRSLVHSLLDALRGIGLQPAILEDRDAGIELARLRHQKASPRRARLVICAGLAAACLVTPLIAQQIALDATGHQLQRLAPVQREITQLHGQMASLTAAQDVIAQAQQGGDVLRTLALLTGALPDGTWLNDLAVNGNTVSFDGQSSNAAHLISVLAATPGLKNGSFDAPVTRTADGTADVFSIQLSISR